MDGRRCHRHVDPIYEGGALKAQVAIATAQQAAAVAQYGSAALTALREVEDALANERYLALQLPLDERALASRTQSVKIATTQFIAGRTDMLVGGTTADRAAGNRVQPDPPARHPARQPRAPVPSAGWGLRRCARGCGPTARRGTD
jgi:hypothetical protein